MQLTPTGFVNGLSADEMSALREKFRRDHAVKLRAFLSPQALWAAQRALSVWERAGRSFYAQADFGGGPLVGRLIAYCNDRELFKFVSYIADSGPIRSIRGEIHQFMPGFLVGWHSDVSDDWNDRAASLSVILNHRSFRGGRFQIRNQKTGRILAEIPNSRGGDAVLFRIHPDLQHANTVIQGRVPKISFNGWFSCSS